MTNDDILRMAHLAGYIGYYADNGRGEQRFDFSKEQLIEFAGLVAAAEREACARVCEETEVVHEKWCVELYDNGGETLMEAAKAIRARGEV